MRRALGILLASILSGPLLAQNITAVNSAGERLTTLVDIPAGAGPFPALVLAPGQGYHMALPVLDQMAQAFLAQGYAVFRFNWSYYSAQPRRQPSADLSQELQELRLVIAAARQHPKVLPDRISVGGKSLGSLLAWQAFRQDAALRSVLLLTPVCSRKPAGQDLPVSEAQKNYAGLAQETRPSLWISGSKDPLCDSAMLYEFAGTARAGTVRLAVVGGDHSFEDKSLPPMLAEASRERTLAAVNALALDFVTEFSR